MNSSTAISSTTMRVWRLRCKISIGLVHQGKKFGRQSSCFTSFICGTGTNLIVITLALATLFFTILWPNTSQLNFSILRKLLTKKPLINPSLINPIIQKLRYAPQWCSWWRSWRAGGRRFWAPRTDSERSKIGYQESGVRNNSMHEHLSSIKHTLPRLIDRRQCVCEMLRKRIRFT